MLRRQGHRQNGWPEVTDEVDVDAVEVEDVAVVGAMVAVEAKGVVDMMVLERWLRTLATVILKKKFQYLIQL